MIQISLTLQLTVFPLCACCFLLDFCAVINLFLNGSGLEAMTWSKCVANVLGLCSVSKNNHSFFRSCSAHEYLWVVHSCHGSRTEGEWHYVSKHDVFSVWWTSPSSTNTDWCEYFVAFGAEAKEGRTLQVMWSSMTTWLWKNDLGHLQEGRALSFTKQCVPICHSSLPKRSLGSS